MLARIWVDVASFQLAGIDSLARSRVLRRHPEGVPPIGCQPCPATQPLDPGESQSVINIVAQHGPCAGSRGK